MRADDILKEVKEISLKQIGLKLEIERLYVLIKEHQTDIEEINSKSKKYTDFMKTYIGDETKKYLSFSKDTDYELDADLVKRFESFVLNEHLERELKINLKEVENKKLKI